MHYRQPIHRPQLAAPASSINIRRLLWQAVPVGVVFAIAAYISLPFAGILYFLLFIAIAFTNTPVALLITFASASVITDLSPGPFKFSFGELNLACLLPICFLRAAHERRPITMGPLFIPATLYVLVCIASTALNFQSAAVNALLQMILYLFAAVVVFSSTVKNPMDLYPSLNASLIVGAVLGVGALTTKYQFLHMHKNAWGAIMSTLTIIGVELWFAATTKKRKRLLMLSIVITGATLFFSVSRGAWLGACTGIFVIIMLRRQFKLALRLMLLLIPLVLVMWAIMPEQDRDYALGFEAERGNIAARYETIDYCRNLFLQHPILGVGVALRKQVDATNIIFVTLAETGVLGLGLFLALHGAFYRMAWRIQAGVARTHPVYSLFAVSTALITRCLTHGLVDHYWSRGPILQAWGAAGMAICAACYLRRTSALRASNSARTTPGRPIPQIPGLQPL